MRFHGLVSIAVLGLSTRALAQNDSVPAPRNTFPPAVRQPESQIPEPSPRALLGDDLDAASSIEAELRQFRSELREFQSVREEVAHSAQTVDRDNDRISLQQRKDLVELLTRLAKKGVGRKPAVASAVPAPGLTPTPSTAPMESEPMVEQPREIDVEISDEVADPFALGKVLFRAGDFVNAEKAFRKVNATSENAPTLNYLIATCLRRQSKWQSAVDVY